MNKEKSYIINSLIVPKEDGDILFHLNGDGTVNAYLDGYAVVPLEKYDNLKSMIQKLIDENYPPEYLNGEIKNESGNN